MDASRRTGKLNAFFTGLGKNREIVLYDTLLEKMSENEIISVVAHELGHAVHKDTWRLFWQQSLQFLFLYTGLALLSTSGSLLTSFGLTKLNFAFAGVILAVLTGPFMILSGIFTKRLSREAEFKADAFSAQHGKAQWLISALQVLTKENLANLNPHPLYVNFYYTHPTLQERIRALR